MAAELEGESDEMRLACDEGFLVMEEDEDFSYSDANLESLQRAQRGPGRGGSTNGKIRKSKAFKKQKNLVARLDDSEQYEYVSGEVEHEMFKIAQRGEKEGEFVENSGFSEDSVIPGSELERGTVSSNKKSIDYIKENAFEFLKRTRDMRLS